MAVLKPSVSIMSEKMRYETQYLFLSYLLMALLPGQPVKYEVFEVNVELAMHTLSLSHSIISHFIHQLLSHTLRDPFLLF